MEEIKKLTIRVTVNEKELIMRKAREARMSVNSYVIKCSLDKEIYAFNELMDFIVALNKAGNNLNQIAKIANAQRYIDKNIIGIIRGAKKVFDSSNKQLKEMMTKMFNSE